jgi:hypothetical protein
MKPVPIENMQLVNGREHLFSFLNQASPSEERIDHLGIV